MRWPAHLLLLRSGRRRRRLRRRRRGGNSRGLGLRLHLRLLLNLLLNRGVGGLRRRHGEGAALHPAWGAGGAGRSAAGPLPREPHVRCRTATRPPARPCPLSPLASCGPERPSAAPAGSARGERRPPPWLPLREERAAATSPASLSGCWGDATAALGLLGSLQLHLSCNLILGQWRELARAGTRHAGTPPPLSHRTHRSPNSLACLPWERLLATKSNRESCWRSRRCRGGNASAGPARWRAGSPQCASAGVGEGGGWQRPVHCTPACVGAGGTGVGALRGAGGH